MALLIWGNSIAFWGCSRLLDDLENLQLEWLGLLLGSAPHVYHLLAGWPVHVLLMLIEEVFVKGKYSCTRPFQASVCIMFTNNSLTKA